MLWRAVAVSWHSGASTEWARAYRLDYHVEDYDEDEYDDDDDDDCDDDDDDEGGDGIDDFNTLWNLK